MNGKKKSSKGKGKSKSGGMGSGIVTAKPKKDTMARNIGNHMGAGDASDMDKSSRVRKTGGRMG